MKKEYLAEAILALRGFVIPVSNESISSIVENILNYLNSEENCEDILNSIKEKTKYNISHITVNTVQDDIHITFVFDSEDELLSEDGCFCYVYNATNPVFSELGYCFFEKDKDKVHRIG